MKLESVRNHITILRENRKRTLREIKAIQYLSRFDFPFSIRWNSYTRDFVILITTYNELHKVRSQLREILGSWNDELKNVQTWNYDLEPKVEYTWKGKVYEGVELFIKYEVLYSQIPDELKNLKTGCKFIFDTEKVEESSKIVLKYVCSKE